GLMVNTLPLHRIPRLGIHIPWFNLGARAEAAVAVLLGLLVALIVGYQYLLGVNSPEAAVEVYVSALGHGDAAAALVATVVDRGPSAADASLLNRAGLQAALANA